MTCPLCPPRFQGKGREKQAEIQNRGREGKGREGGEGVRAVVQRDNGKVKHGEEGDSRDRDISQDTDDSEERFPSLSFLLHFSVDRIPSSSSSTLIGPRRCALSTVIGQSRARADSNDEKMEECSLVVN